MTLPVLRLVDPMPEALGLTRADPRRLGEILQDRGWLERGDLITSLVRQRQTGVPLGRILMVDNLIGEASLTAALSQQFAAPMADLDRLPPDPHLARDIPPETCLALGALPWRQVGDTVFIALSEPARFGEIRRHLPAAWADARPAIAPLGMIERHISLANAATLSARAELRCPAELSCRSWARPLRRPLVLAVMLAMVAAGITFPTTAIWLLYLWLMINLAAMSLLRLTALYQQGRTWLAQTAPAPDIRATLAHCAALPAVSVLVPLYREAAMLPLLVQRLQRLDYPKELLDICLVLEASDTETLAAAAKLQLPHWIRVIAVPASNLKTKPRAMNYALDFCRGEIIGIYDAEDAPEPDQISRMVARFLREGPEVACIQGYLDYYNPRQNWLARSFSIEYAVWFRLVLQGVERMRLPVPLGGTGVFFRRDALEALGGWDAHNVTEDADLGMRLARAGYRCAFEPTTTFEEANCHVLPWIKQRSRWLKGYAMTWITHMRKPRTLWRDLGPRGFLTFHIILLGTLSNFLLAPAIWSFWLIAFGFRPEFVGYLPASAWTLMATAYLLSEGLMAVLGFVAVSGRDHRHLLPYVLTMPFYWPLGTAAAFKALYELLLAPFYWDKTIHGISAGPASTSAAPSLSPPPRRHRV
ncbi:MAG: glycosyltransferase [Rhodobacteraceae bacterium]|nr:glycosyltransferase [Paracoccaceae bacterium]